MRGCLADYDTLASRLADYEWSDPESLQHGEIVQALVETAMRCGWRPASSDKVSVWAHNRLRTLRGHSDPSFATSNFITERRVAA